MPKTLLSRKEREDRLIDAHMELQLCWGRFTRAFDWEFVRKWDDDRINQELKECIGQIRFQKSLSAAKSIFKITVGVIVVLGIAGLLLFGIRQLLMLLR
jgi:hypothetical protein